MKPQLLLASQSPRRKAILEFIGVPFRVEKPTDVRELQKPHELPSGMVRRLALEKAMVVSRKFPGYWILGADTVVASGKKTFGKPKNRREAARMLMALQNGSHEVWTGVALIGPGGGTIQTHIEKTKVSFKPLSLKAIDTYLRSKEPYDKAGAYDIQGTARTWVERWEGDYFNIMGLPVRWLIPTLNRFMAPAINRSRRS